MNIIYIIIKLFITWEMDIESSTINYKDLLKLLLLYSYFTKVFSVQP